MRDSIHIRRVRNGFIVGYEPDHRLNAFPPMESNEFICEDSEAVLKALAELFEEIETRAKQPVAPEDMAYQRYDSFRAAGLGIAAGQIANPQELINSENAEHHAQLAAAQPNGSDQQD